MMYRPSHINSYTRLNMIAPPQRTEEEHRLLQFTRWPEHYVFFWIMCTASIFVNYAWLYSKPMSGAENRNRAMAGAMNQHELWKRNDEMDDIFKMHKELIAETRKNFAPKRPAVFNPPDNGANWHDSTA
jgi:hypothetical protein